MKTPMRVLVKPHRLLLVPLEGFVVRIRRRDKHASPTMSEQLPAEDEAEPFVAFPACPLLAVAARPPGAQPDGAHHARRVRLDRGHQGDHLTGCAIAYPRRLSIERSPFRRHGGGGGGGGGRDAAIRDERVRGYLTVRVPARRSTANQIPFDIERRGRRCVKRDDAVII